MNIRVTSRFAGRTLPVYLYDAGYQKLLEEESWRWPFYQLVCCYQGTGGIRLGDERHALKPGTVVFLPPGTAHTYEAGLAPYYLSWVSFLGPIASTLPACYGVAEPLQPAIVEDVHHPDLHLRIMSVLEYAEWDDSAERISVLLYGIYTEYLLRLVSRSGGREEPAARRHVHAAVQWMRERLHLPADIGELARCLNLSRQHVNRLFRQRYGTTTKDFYLKLKMLQAQKDLIHFPETDVQTIAARLGFVNASHFARVFRQMTGVSPSRFREVDDGKRRQFGAESET
ncbi:AraC family transcriptional regulator [Paenibacillus cymbidii]|uniref:AraC family transcriptional regulator n=1 Tax=Paenibacillus cymbidii TaxID=1639034 RepID=UPI0014368C75|nr:AraC family transcriptional regulator [Paenibacillus cymbidii]